MQREDEEVKVGCKCCVKTFYGFIYAMHHIISHYTLDTALEP